MESRELNKAFRNQINYSESLLAPSLVVVRIRLPLVKDRKMLSNPLATVTVVNYSYFSCWIWNNILFFSLLLLGFGYSRVGQ